MPAENPLGMFAAYRTMYAGTPRPFDLDDATVTGMRQWAGECQWAEGDDLDLDELPASLIVAAIERNYDGGVAGFIRDGI